MNVWGQSKSSSGVSVETTNIKLVVRLEEKSESLRCIMWELWVTLPHFIQFYPGLKWLTDTIILIATASMATEIMIINNKSS